MKLSILIPVYNERTVVERSLAGVLAAPMPEHMERELVIVDDCSTDGTLAIFERLAAQHPEIRLIRHRKNSGKGAAVRTAIEQATGEFSLVQDADLEYDPSEYPAPAATPAGWPRRRGLRLPLSGRRTEPRAAVLALHDQQGL